MEQRERMAWGWSEEETQSFSDKYSAMWAIDTKTKQEHIQCYQSKKCRFLQQPAFLTSVACETLVAGWSPIRVWDSASCADEPFPLLREFACALRHGWCPAGWRSMCFRGRGGIKVAPSSWTSLETSNTTNCCTHFCHWLGYIKQFRGKELGIRKKKKNIPFCSYITSNNETKEDSFKPDSWITVKPR